MALFNFFFFFSLLLKLGGVPFQLWYLKLIQKLDWGLIWLLSVWQKLIPLLLLSLRNLSLFITFGGLRALLRRLATWKQKKIKKIFGLSSIFSLGWILMSFLVNNSVWIIFILGYGLSLLVLVLIFLQINLSSSYKISSFLGPYSMRVFICALLILRGIPPFIGFFLKLVVLTFLLKINFLVSLGLLLLRLYLIFVYLRILFLSLTCAKPGNLIKASQNKIIWHEIIISNIFVSGLVINLLYCIIIHK